MPGIGYKLKNVLVSFWHLYEWMKTNMIILTKNKQKIRKHICVQLTNYFS